MSSSASDNAAKCPLGFTGTPPVGHPAIPGLFASNDSKPLSSGASEKKGGLTCLTASESEAKARWSPSLLLTLDAIFLAACFLVAIYWPQLKDLSATFKLADLVPRVSFNLGRT
ncbi:hypothetical protein CBOM_03407 [Ceraceosorus bombacis]|uniref:Uncharacterized protein n=1 Tax=Ceraceosorus bombacis TaxID=401625 RepID=A0A0P1BM82_9BASI|nr:hypothetical protein CBOM_03407 [Ceraceosorus bombacis]